MTKQPRAARLHELRARLLQLRAVTAGDLDFLLELAQIVKRLDDAGSDFKVQTNVHFDSGRASLDVVWLGQLAQVSPVKAREVAWILLEAAAVAESEGTLVHYLTSEVGLEEEGIAAVLSALRAARAGGDSSLLLRPLMGKPS